MEKGQAENQVRQKILSLWLKRSLEKRCAEREAQPTLNLKPPLGLNLGTQHSGCDVADVSPRSVNHTQINQHSVVPCFALKSSGDQESIRVDKCLRSTSDRSSVNGTK